MSDYLYRRFVTEEFDGDGTLIRLTHNVPENFNFSYDVVDVLAQKVPDKRAILWTNDKGAEKDISFSCLSRESMRAASFFAAQGLKKGDKVMLILKRHYQFWYIILALHRLGCIVIPATNQLMEKDIVYRIEKAHVRAVVCTTDGEIADYVDGAVQNTSGVDRLFCVNGCRDGWIDFDEGYAGFEPDFPRPTGALANSRSDTMLMYFTSGTTGYPKACMLPYEYPIGHIITARYWQCVNPDGLHLTLAETGWGKAIWGKLYGQFLCEAAVFVYDFDRFKPTDVLHVIEKYRITTLCAPPTIFRFLIKEDMSSYDLSSLEYVTTAGEAINPEVFNKFCQYTGHSLMEAFGQTETTVLLGNFRGVKLHDGSMGKASPQYDIDLVDDDGNSVQPGVVGEISVRTKDNKLPVGLFCGYYEDEEMTAQAYHDNIYHTRDLAWRDEDGYYFYVSRKDDVIKSSGYRIGPFEIESVLMEHPAVLECAVTGVPDPVRGQVVKATIVLTEDYRNADREALAKEIQEYVKHTTAPYKYPRVVDFANELPKTISGKIIRHVLR